MPRIILILFSLILLIYPLLLFISTNIFDIPIKYIGLSLITLLFIRILLILRTKKHQVLIPKKYLFIISTLGMILGISIFLHPDIFLAQLYPVFINYTLCGIFSYSLRCPPSIIEIVARIQYTKFPEKAILYTCKVTKVWAIFFLINGSIALFTTFFTSMSIWMLYNGFIAYILIGIIFIIEYYYRLTIQNKYLSS